MVRNIKRTEIIYSFKAKTNTTSKTVQLWTFIQYMNKISVRTYIETYPSTPHPSILLRFYVDICHQTWNVTRFLSNTENLATANCQEFSKCITSS